MNIEKLMEILKGTEEVVFRINGLGEEVYTTKEIHECIEPLYEKQVAKKPDDCGDCPECHCSVQETIYENDPDYGAYEIYDDCCRACGQHIDWSEEE